MNANIQGEGRKFRQDSMIPLVRRLALNASLFLYSSLTLAQSFGPIIPTPSSIDGPDAQITFYDAKNEAHIYPLKKVKAGTHFYHWTDKEKRVQTWSQAGRVPPEEMTARITQGFGKDGGGVYTSFDTLDSSNIGPFMMVFTAPKDLYLTNSRDHRAMIDIMGEQDEVKTSLALAKAGVHGIQDSWVETYVNWITPEAVAQVRLGNEKDILGGMLPLTPERLGKLYQNSSIVSTNGVEDHDTWFYKLSSLIAKKWIEEGRLAPGQENALRDTLMRLPMHSDVYKSAAYWKKFLKDHTRGAFEPVPNDSDAHSTSAND